MHKFTLSSLVLAASMAANLGVAATFSFTTPTAGVQPPEKVGDFSYTGPTSYFPAKVYMDSSLTIPPIAMGESITKYFTVLSGYPSLLINMTADAVSSSGNYVDAQVSCSPPLTTTTAGLNEPCDIAVSFSRYNESDEDIFVTVKGYASSTKFVETTFLIHSLSPAASIPSLILTPSPTVSFPDTGVNQEASSTFSLYNTSDSEDILDLSIFTDSPYFNIDSSSCYSSLPPQGSCSFSVKFSAGDIGDYLSTLVAYSPSASNGVQTTMMSGAIVGLPNLVDITSIPTSFTLLEGDSTSVTLTYQNQGVYKSTNTFQELSGDSIVSTVPFNNCGAQGAPIELYPSDTCDVQLSISALTAGNYVAYSTISSDKSSVTSQINLTVNPAESIPELVSGSLNFGSMLPDQVKSSSITIRNRGYVPANFAYLTIPSILGLSVSSNTCGTSDSPVSVPVQGTCSLTLSYSSPSASSLTGSVDVMGFDYPLSVPVSATVSAATSVATVTGSSISFGSVVQNSASVSRSVSVQNTGNSAMTLSGVAGLPTLVSLTGNTCSNVAVNGTCSLTFTMGTSTVSSFSGVSVTTIGATTNASISMTGSVIAATSIATISNGSLNFGAIALDSSNASAVDRSVTVTNTGNSPLTVSGASGLPTGVSIQTNTCSSVAANGTCSIVFRLKSDTATSFSGASVTLVGSTGQGAISMTGSVVVPTMDISVTHSVPSSTGTSSSLTVTSTFTATPSGTPAPTSPVTGTFSVTGSPSGGTASVTPGAITCGSVVSGGSCNAATGTLTFPAGTGSITVTRVYSIGAGAGSASFTSSFTQTSSATKDVTASNNTTTSSTTIALVNTVKQCMFATTNVPVRLGAAECSVYGCSTTNTVVSSDGTNTSSTAGGALNAAAFFGNLFDASGLGTFTRPSSHVLYSNPATRTYNAFWGPSSWTLASAKWKGTNISATAFNSSSVSGATPADMTWPFHPILQVKSSTGVWSTYYKSFLNGKLTNSALIYWTGTGSNPGQYATSTQCAPGQNNVIPTGAGSALAPKWDANSGAMTTGATSYGKTCDGTEYRMIWEEYTPGPNCAAAGTVLVPK